MRACRLFCIATVVSFLAACNSCGQRHALGPAENADASVPSDLASVVPTPSDLARADMATSPCQTLKVDSVRELGVDIMPLGVYQVAKSATAVAVLRQVTPDAARCNALDTLYYNGAPIATAPCLRAGWAADGLGAGGNETFLVSMFNVNAGETLGTLLRLNREAHLTAMAETATVEVNAIGDDRAIETVRERLDWAWNVYTLDQNLGLANVAKVDVRERGSNTLFSHVAVLEGNLVATGFWKPLGGNTMVKATVVSPMGKVTPIAVHSLAQECRQAPCPEKWNFAKPLASEPAGEFALFYANTEKPATDNTHLARYNFAGKKLGEVVFPVGVEDIEYVAPDRFVGITNPRGVGGGSIELLLLDRKGAVLDRATLAKVAKPSTGSSFVATEPGGHSFVGTWEVADKRHLVAATCR